MIPLSTDTQPAGRIGDGALLRCAFSGAALVLMALLVGIAATTSGFVISNWNLIWLGAGMTAVTVVGVAAISPGAILPLYVVILILGPSVFTDLPFISRGIRPDMLLLAIVMLVLIVRLFLGCREIRLGPVVFVLGLYVVWAIASLWVNFTIRPGAITPVSWISVQGDLRLVVVFILFYSLVRAEHDILNILLALLAAGVIAHCIGFAQLTVPAAADFVMNYYQSATKPLQEFFRVDPFATSTFDSSHVAYGVFAAMNVLVAVAVYERARNRTRKVCIVFLGMIALAGLAASASRSGIAVLLVSVPTYLLVRWRGRGWRVFRTVAVVTAGVALLVGAAVFLLGDYSQYYVDPFWHVISLTTWSGASIYESRIPNWEASLAMLRASPIVGGGPGMGGLVDSFYFVVLAQRGVVGLAVFVTGLALMMRSLFVGSQTNRSPLCEIMRSMFISLTLAFLGVGIGFSAFNSSRIGELYFSIGGATLGMLRNRTRHRSNIGV